MIKRLRAKFIWVSMTVFGIMLLVIFGLVRHFTVISMEEQSLMAIRSATEQAGQPPDNWMELPGRTEQPSGNRTEIRQPVFFLMLTQDDRLVAVGSDFYDLTDESYLRQLLQEVQAENKETGILSAYSLRYLCLGQRVYFMDISAQIQSANAQLVILLVTGVVAMGAFFFVSLLLSRWMVRPVEEAWERQRQFVGDASHELKTPLTVILTNAELLRAPDYDDTAKARFTESILSMARQMRGLVEGMLDLARVDGGNVRAQMEPLDFSELTENTLLPFEPVYFEAGRELCSRVEPGIRVNGSGRHLRQVVEILLDNGCKYGAPGQAVTLTLQRQGRNHCLLKVTSCGQSLTPQQCREIFKRFYRVDEARSMNHSYGLGLPIAMGIVSDHRGKIWAEGKDGHNTFFVSLPTTL